MLIVYPRFMKFERIAKMDGIRTIVIGTESFNGICSRRVLKDTKRLLLQSIDLLVVENALDIWLVFCVDKGALQWHDPLGIQRTS